MKILIHGLTVISYSMIMQQLKWVITIWHRLANASPLVTDVDYDGVIMRVYIWLEGTDADCC